MYKNIHATEIKANNTFTLAFASSFFVRKGTEYSLSSTPFRINGVDHHFGDIEIADSDNRTVMVYKTINGVNQIVIPEAGLINPVTGIITINNFVPDDASDIRITIIPNSLDIAPKRNQIINIEASRILASGSIDNIAYSGPSGAIDYTTTSRLR